MDNQIRADASKATKGLDEQAKKVGKKWVRQALRAGAKVIHAVAVATAPVFTGLTQSSIKVRSGGSKKGVIKVNIGVGKDWFKGPTFYAAFEAFGHKIGKRQLGDQRKQVPPNEWLEKAYNSTKEEAVEVFKTTIAELIEGNQ